LFLLSTLVAAALFITWAIFDKNPTVLYTPHIPDIVVLNNIIQKISSNLLNEETSQQLIDPNILLVLELNEKEVNEIILSGIQTYINSGENPQACEQLKNFRIKFKDGFFYADYSFLTNITSPFGSYINIHCVFVPELSNDNINVNVSSLKIGALSMPSSKIDKFIRDAIKKEKNNKNVQLFLNSVKEIKVKDSKLLIKYSPSAALNLILNQSNSAL
ncbi:MAG TPA: hypothetical protein P5105_04715, partial [Victivallales bacterium]|nr:hypothetical protein [Victivallales bacterium]